MPTATWQDLAAVWHFDATDPAVEPDATGVRDATGSAQLQAADVVAGQLGRGLRFEGDDRLDFVNPYAGNTPHTISVWVNQDNSTDAEAIVAVGNSMCGQARWFYTRYLLDTVATGFYCNDWGNPNLDVTGQGWTLLHWVYDGNNVGRLYRDGAQVAGPFTYTGSPGTAGAGGYIGNAPTGFGVNMGLHGVLDELRLATVARTGAWITAEYANQRTGSTFYSLGPEQP